ncbi:MAG: sucrose-6-phosphate hydrolase [Aerococcus sp.]|nr:sucrose-6-phosphate hydrolase [Aerococcus sp.]
MTKKMTVTNPRYRLGYHIQAPAGWINDPNGFCYFKGYYHIFYQHHPYSQDWGPMHWGHARSKDLVHWETLPIAIAPDTPNDEDGCFSGSAIVKDDILYLIYTGHHYYGDNDPDHFWENQNLAYSKDGIHFEKYDQPIIDKAPEDNTHHFRDPKVWEEKGHYYLVLGSQEEDGLGRVLLYTSDNLLDWEYVGKIAKSQKVETEGYMWECPDFFSLNNGEEEKHILLFSPQGVKADGKDYLNIFETGYLVGDYDKATHTLHRGSFKEIDRGHDFYASQTTLTPDGRRVVFGWMDMWESDFPEKADGWAGALTLPRELNLVGDQLQMIPARELVKLRTSTLAEAQETVAAPTILLAGQKQAELGLTLDQPGDFTLVFQGDAADPFLTLHYTADTKEWQLHRPDKETDRFVQSQTDERVNVHLFLDTSSAEFFINNGETTFTERFYVEEDYQVILQPTSETAIDYATYTLSGDAVQY